MPASVATGMVGRDCNPSKKLWKCKCRHCFVISFMASTWTFTMVSTSNITPIFIRSVYLGAITVLNNASRTTGNHAFLTYCKHFAEFDDTEWGEQEEPTMPIHFPTDLLLWGKLLLLFFSCALSWCPHRFLPTEHYTQNNTINFGRVRAVPRLCELYTSICLTTEEKARKNVSATLEHSVDETGVPP